MFDDDMARHIQWSEETHGLRPFTGKERGMHSGCLLNDQRQFADSRGLQLADNLASILRRALNDHLGLAGWKDFGQLVVRKRHPGASFLRLGQDENPPETLKGHAAKVCRTLDQ